MRDTFKTIHYRGEYIQTCCEDGKDVIEWGGKKFCSVKNAKIAIGIHLRVKESNPHLKIDKFGFPQDYFLVAGKDGMVKVKDGRSLEEYINNEYFVENRKHVMNNSGEEFVEYIMIPAKKYEELNIPHIA
jgi:hypothetical protein